MQIQHTRTAAEPVSAITSTSSGDTARGDRLIVVVGSVSEPAHLASRILHAAQTHSRRVLLIGVVARALDEPEMRRGLALLAGFVRATGTQTETRIEHDLGWIASVRGHLGDDDVLACCGENRAITAEGPWVDVLARRFDRPIVAFTDAAIAPTQTGGVLSSLAPWLASAAVIAGFSWLQIRISQYADSPLITAALILSVVLEVGLIWLGNAVIG